MSALSLKRMIHVGCKQLGLDADTRRDLQLVATGKASMSGMTEDELRLVIEALKNRGFKPYGSPHFTSDKGRAPGRGQGRDQAERDGQIEGEVHCSAAPAPAARSFASTIDRRTPGPGASFARASGTLVST